MINEELNQALYLLSLPNSQQMKEGEAILAHLRKNANYPLNLLFYINNNQDFQFQLKAAIELKIWCTSYEELEVFERAYYQQVIEQVKSQILLAYLVMPNKISETLRPGIVKLTEVEFPRNWQHLMIKLMQYATQNANSIHSVLLLIQDITKKYSILSRSDPLSQEIIMVCHQIHDFLLDVPVKIIQSQTKDQAAQGFLETLLKILYHLNFQNPHPKFEGNTKNWMEFFKNIIGFPNYTRKIVNCKIAALQSIILFMDKYNLNIESQIFHKGSDQIVEWFLFSIATADPQFDSIVLNCLKYFKNKILMQEMKQIFRDNLGLLIEKLILPNLSFKRNVIDLFNEEPDFFFEQYFKKNNIQNRRSASLDLLRVICRSYPNLENYVLSKIQAFKSNMANASIQEKCNHFHFLIYTATKSFSDLDGCTDTYISSDILVQCYEQVIYNDFQLIAKWICNNQTKMIEDKDGINKCLLITYLRFCYFFRIFIPKKNYEEFIKLALVIKTNSKPIKTMLFMTINAFISIRHGDFVHFRNFVPFFNAQNSHKFTKLILQTIQQNDQSQTELNENLTKILYNLAKILGQCSVQYYELFDVLIPQMLLKTQRQSKSALYLFQAIGEIALHVSKKGGKEKKKLENHIFNYFDASMKRNNNNDLPSYCLQILSILVHKNQKNKRYQNIYKSMLDFRNWMEGRWKSVQILSFNSELIQMKYLEEIVWILYIQDNISLIFQIFQKILSISNFDIFQQYGYFKLSIKAIKQVSKSILSKKFGVLFIFKLMNNYDLNKVIQCMNNISPDLFLNIITGSQDIIRTIQLKKDRKIMYLALCKVISQGVLSYQIEGRLLSLLIENSTHKFSQLNPKNTIEGLYQSQKKQAAYRKLQVFNQIQTKEHDLEVDEEKELCKTYMICQNNKRDSLSILNPKNFETMARLKDEHGQSLGLGYQNNQEGNTIYF